MGDSKRKLNTMKSISKDRIEQNYQKKLEYYSSRNSKMLAKWKADNLIGSSLWTIEDPKGRFTLENVQTKFGLAIVQVYDDKSFVIYNNSHS